LKKGSKSVKVAPTCDVTIADVDDRGISGGEGVFTNEGQATVLLAVVTGFIPGAEERQSMKAKVDEGDPMNRIREDGLSF
jgi:hypothetical protein